MNNSYDALVKKGFLEAKAITKKRARSFFFASRFLPKEKRNAAFSIYAICRIGDDTVDSAAGHNPLENLSRLKEKINYVYAEDSRPQETLLAAFKNTVDKYNIPKACFEELIEGLYMDLNKKRYRNFEELRLYCYRVAGVAGLMMLKIFGSGNQEAEECAIDLGIAMQLTNILRDIKEDFQRGRIYLPQDEMEKYGVSEEYLSRQCAKASLLSSGFKELARSEIARARQYYANSQKGITMIENRGARFVARVMKELYAGILESIEKNNYDVFSRRAHLNSFGKLIKTLKILVKGKFL